MRKKAIPAWWHVFISAYMTNNENAAAAYRAARPKVNVKTAKGEASKLLKDPCFAPLLEAAKAKVAVACEYSRDEYFQKLTKVARFDPTKLFVLDPKKGMTKLRRDWVTHIPHGVGARIRCKAYQQSNGPTRPPLSLMEISFEPHSSMEANEKLGRLLGYDTSDEPTKSKGDLIINLGKEYQMVEPPEEAKK